MAFRVLTTCFWRDSLTRWLCSWVFFCCLQTSPPWPLILTLKYCKKRSWTLWEFSNCWCHRLVKISRENQQGQSVVYILVLKQYSYPPPSEMIFFPLSLQVIFRLRPCLFALILQFCFYFSLLLPIFSFSLSFLRFLSSSFFYKIFHLFIFPFSYFSPLMTSANILPSPGGGIFQNIDLRYQWHPTKS